MNPDDIQQPPPDHPELPKLRTETNPPSSPRLPLLATPTSGAQRKIAIAVDLSDESAYAIRWAVENYLREGDAVVLLHVSHTSVYYGADWGFVNLRRTPSAANSEDNLNSDDIEKELTASNAKNIAEPLDEANIPYKIHIVKDHDMKERLCLEVERLGLSAMIMGSRGVGFTGKKRSKKGRLGSVSNYCVNHCVCPVIVVRFPVEGESENGVVAEVGEEDELHPVPEEDTEDHEDGSDEQKGNPSPTNPKIK